MNAHSSIGKVLLSRSGQPLRGWRNTILVSDGFVPLPGGPGGPGDGTEPPSIPGYDWNKFEGPGALLGTWGRVYQTPSGPPYPTSVESYPPLANPWFQRSYVDSGWGMGSDACVREGTDGGVDTTFAAISRREESAYMASNMRDLHESGEVPHLLMQMAIGSLRTRRYNFGALQTSVLDMPFAIFLGGRLFAYPGTGSAGAEVPSPLPSGGWESGAPIGWANAGVFRPPHGAADPSWGDMGLETRVSEMSTLRVVVRIPRSILEKVFIDTFGVLSIALVPWGPIPTPPRYPPYPADYGCASEAWGGSLAGPPNDGSSDLGAYPAIEWIGVPKS